jgi:uncharacterized protein (DUF885 family)
MRFHKLSIAALAACATMAFTATSAAPQPLEHAGAYDARFIDLEQRYTAWSLHENPTSATDAGVHDVDDKLADFSPQAQAAQMDRLRGFRNELAALTPPPGSSRHDIVDYLLVRSDLEGDYWSRTVLHPLERNPSVYEGECANGIFSIVKRPYASDTRRIEDAIGRLRACPNVLAQGEANLTEMVREFAQIASGDVRDGDSLYTTSLDELARNVSQAQRAQLHQAVSAALSALHAYRTWLDAHMQSDRSGGFAVGRDQYNWYLKRVLLLPYDADQVAAIGTQELARDRALEAWEENRDRTLPQPPERKFADKAAFLQQYQSSLAVLKRFLKSHRVVDIPAYVGPFHIVEVPKALAATYPGGFMNPPAMLGKDPEGFYFVPDFSPSNQSFFVAYARQSVLPILGHEGIPGHFLQFSYAYHNPDFIRHVHDDGVFAEGWAFYGEEMLMRLGLYDADPAARKQVIHLMRHRATRVGVDVGLATGAMSLPQAIAYFKKNAGIDSDTASGEATRFAMDPSQAIDYLVGKTQIETLLGIYRDANGTSQPLSAFHDRLLSYGTVPYSVIRSEWFDDDTWLQPALDPIAPEEFK